MSAGQTIVAAGLVAVLSGVALSAGPAREIIDEDIDRAMGEAKRFLWSRQTAAGHWSHWSHSIRDYQNTAIATFALLEAGESPNDPRMKKALAALAEFDTTDLYTVATRVMALTVAGAGRKESPHHGRLQADMKYLTAQAIRQGGAWGYGGPERLGDNSCSQFALLALWEADRAGVQIDPALVRLVERTWLARQRDDGGWTYSGQPDVKTDSTLTMTTAGLASLYICQDVLTKTCKPYPRRQAADAGWAYLNAKVKGDYHTNGYLAFCVQRVGMASGQKVIAGMDWLAAGAAKLAEPNPRGRSYAGQWGPVVRASFELLFLARGQIPLTFNKLAHGDEANWNYHTRDVPHFTEFMRRSLERRMRWQIVSINDDVPGMLDAPILLVTGRQALDFTPAQWAKLREYTLRGGTLLFVPSHNSKGFLDSAKAGLETLYEDLIRNDSLRYMLQPLPAAHPLYNVHEKIANGPKLTPLWGVADGTRLLAVLAKRDIACAWHRRAEKNRAAKLDFQVGVNFLLYATGSNSLRMRMRPVFAGKGGEPRTRVKTAWLKHGGNWSAQPFALEYLSQKLTAEHRIALDVASGVEIDAAGLAGHKLAWLTGSAPFTLTADQLKALRAYLDGGGTLFVNAVGGSRDFTKAAEKMLEDLLAGADVVSGNPPPDSPLITGRCGEFWGAPLAKLKRTSIWRKTSPAPRSPLRVYRRDGRAVVIYARHGVHDTLDGHTAHGAFSYMPASAREIAANVVLHAIMKKPAKR